MKLECAQSIESPAATEADIKNAFKDDTGRGEYIILSESEEVFIQASGEFEGPYTVEYRDGTPKRYWRCTSSKNKAEVEPLFLKYLRRDGSWRTDITWRQLEFKPW